MEIKFIDPIENVEELEDIRHHAFGLGSSHSQYYIQQLLSGNLMVVGAYIDNELVGAAYLGLLSSNICDIAQLFVKPEYQRSEYHVGSKILKYIEMNINKFEEFNDNKITKVIISPGSPESEKIYRDSGYRDTALDGTLYRRPR